MAGLPTKFPREYQNWRAFHRGHDNLTFRAYLIRRGVLVLQSRAPGTVIRGVGRVIATPKDPSLWPQGTITEIQFGETDKYKKEKRWIYKSVPVNPPPVNPPGGFFWDDDQPPPDLGPPPPPPGLTAA
jgi:hypothetical protein